MTQILSAHVFFTGARAIVSLQEMSGWSMWLVRTPVQMKEDTDAMLPDHHVSQATHHLSGELN